MKLSLASVLVRAPEGQFRDIDVQVW